jgi:hypothetical protein
MHTNLTAIPHRKIKNLAGQKFRNWSFVQLSHRKGKYLFWTCRCECGAEKALRPDSVKRGVARCENCIRQRKLERAQRTVRRVLAGRKNHPEDLAGRTFGILRVISFHHKGQYQRYWNCVCVCGTERIVRADLIKEGASCRVCRSNEIKEAINNRTQKPCSICKLVLDFKCFNKDSHTRDGYHGRCKECVITISHQQQARLKSRSPEEIVAPNEKRCRKCRSTKPIEEFWKTMMGSDGYTSRCKTCLTEQAIQIKWGLSKVDVMLMLAAQRDRCAICRKQFNLGSFRPYAIDHCHATGRIRGILCRLCNTGLGMFRDSPQFLRSAARYIEKHRKPPASVATSSQLSLAF